MTKPTCPRCGVPCMWDEGNYGDRQGEAPVVLGSWYCVGCEIDVDGDPPTANERDRQKRADLTAPE